MSSSLRRAFTHPTDPERGFPPILLRGLVVALLIGLVWGSYAAGFRNGTKHPETVVVKNVVNTDSQANADFGTFWQAWKLIDDNYLKNQDADAQKKVYGAIEGMVASLGDPHSVFFPPQENTKFQEDISGNFGGIGAELGMQKGGVVVIAPLKSTPAEAAGIKSGDMILKVNASSTEGLTLDEVVNRIRGPKGTQVTLSIFREGWDAPKDMKITRALINVPTLDAQMKEGNIAYIQLYSFNARAEQLFREAMTRLLAQGAKGVVLDLRNDPGGYLEVAVDLAGWFVPRNTIVVSEASRIAPKEDLRAEGNEALVNVPAAVLINEGSASASEILAGALRDIRKVPLIGQQSFGKGTVQQLFSLRDNASIKLTIAHWVLPSGQVLENGGLKPDFEIKISEDDLKNKKDPQLDKALEVVKSKIK